MEALLVVTSILLFPGILLFPFVAHRFFMLDFTKGGSQENPLIIFACSVLTLLVVLAFTFFSLRLIVFVVQEFPQPLRVFCYLFLTLAAWVGVYRLYTGSSYPDRAALERRAATKMQIWMQDFIVAALVLGCAWAVVSSLAGEHTPNNEMSFYLATEMFTIAPAFFIGLSVLRFQRGQSPLTRALWLAAILALGAIPGVSIFLMYPAWITWVCTLSRMPEKVSPK